MRTSIAALAVIVAATGCGTPVISFEVPVTAETTIARGTVLEQLLDAFGFADFANVDLEDTREFDNNDVRREQVTSARLTALNLSIVSPQGADFDWLDALSFSVAADGQAETRVANKNVADGQSAFSCDLDDVELAPFVRAARFAITTEAEARRPPQDTTIRVDLTFAISAEVL